MIKKTGKRMISVAVLAGMVVSLNGTAFAGFEIAGAANAAAAQPDAVILQDAQQANVELVQDIEIAVPGDEAAYSQGQFLADLNDALGYVYGTNESREPITRQEAARILYDALNYSDVAESNPDDDFLDIREIREAAYLEAPFEDVDQDSAYFKEIAALWYYGALDVFDGAFRPEDNLDALEAAIILENALTATITVADGADEIVRDNMIVPVKLGVQTEEPDPAGFGKIQTLEEGTAVLAGDDMLVPMNIGALLGGSVSNVEDGQMTIIMGGTPDGADLILNEATFDVDADGRISLQAVADAFGGEMTMDGDTAILTFPRHILKSNRDLTEEEKTYSYTKLYLEYWQTPLPERSDEVAWAKEQSKYDAETPSKEAGGTLYPPTYYKMAEEGYDPYAEEGWSISADGRWASICVVSPIKGELEDAVAFSWWFAWHGLRDVRYMTWYPPAHWGLGIQNGNDAGRDGNNPNKQFRSFNTDLSIHQRSYGLGHSVAEDTTRTSYNGSTDWIDFYLTKAKPAVDVNTGLNFKDLTNMTDTSPMGSSDGITYTTHFSVSEDNSGRYMTLLLDDPQQIGTVGFSGQYMCHFLRWDKETKKAEIITHFSSYNPQGWANGGASMPGLAMHATREFARLADILAELYELEGQTPLEDDYDERSYVFEEIPDETTADFYAAINEIAGEDILTGGDDSSLTRAQAAQALVKALPQAAPEEEIKAAWENTPAYLKFSDVNEDTEGFLDIITLHYYGSLDAISGTYRPEHPLSSSEAQKMLANVQIATITLPVGEASVSVDHVESILDTQTLLARDRWEIENSGSSAGAASANESADDADSDGDSASDEAAGNADAADSETNESAGESAAGEAREDDSQAGMSSGSQSSTYTTDDVYADPQFAAALGAEVSIEGEEAMITLADVTNALTLTDRRISLREFAEAFADAAGMSVSFRANTLEDGTVNIYEAVIKADRTIVTP